MTIDEKLAAILAAVQVDPGHRGLKNLFAACPDDFAAACRSIAGEEKPILSLVTGFYIPTATPPAFETDGPLGALFLARTMYAIGGAFSLHAESPIANAFEKALTCTGIEPTPIASDTDKPIVAAIERSGPAKDGKCYTMRGRDISPHVSEHNKWFLDNFEMAIGIGDGGNEIGMGKISHEIVARDVPNGDLIHCRVPTDHLIVAGVSNWGAYALAAGIFVLRGIKPPPDRFDPDREREILGVMVREGPLVDGVTGQQTATVDGLSWEEYAKPLVQIRDILGS